MISDVQPVQSGTIDSSHRDCRDDRHGRKKGPRRHNALPALPEEWRSRINAQELSVLDDLMVMRVVSMRV